MIDLNKKNETFVKKSSRNNSKLYLVNNLNDLLSSKLFSEKQLQNFKTNYKFNSASVFYALSLKGNFYIYLLKFKELLKKFKFLIKK